jgi:hypothetical protein
LNVAFIVDAESFHGRRQGLTTEDTEGTERRMITLLAEFVFGSRRFSFPDLAFAADEVFVGG